MKKILFLLALLMGFTSRSQELIPQPKSYLPEKPYLQAGVAVLPLFDVLQIFPQNKISGAALFGELGVSIGPRFNMGIHPYFASAMNTYSFDPAQPVAYRQELSFIGLNTYLRGYFLSNSRWAFYLFASAGFGNLGERTRDLQTGKFLTPQAHYSSIATFLAGPGVNYFLGRRLALAFNLPYAVMYNFSAPAAEKYFLTVTPNIGFHVFWNRTTQ